MFTITRSLARQFRALMRRAGLGKHESQPDAFIHVDASASGLRWKVAGHEVAIEYHETGEFAAEQCVIPSEVLGIVEGSKPEPVTFEPTANGSVTINFTDRGVPQLLDRSIDRKLKLPAWPTLPETWTANPSRFWSALREAVATTDRESTRYALGCVQCCGATGELSATDGHQVLVQGGFDFPWPDGLLIPGNRLLGGKELETSEPIEVGIAGDWVTFRLGRWRISLKIQREGRFPKLESVFPSRESAQSQLRLAPADVSFLQSAIPGLPSNDEVMNPVTLDLNGQVIIRAKGEGNSRVRELVLSNSRLDGTAVRLNYDRRFVARALQLGFHELSIIDAKSIVVCYDELRRYAWMPLSEEGVIPTSADAFRTVSPTTASVSPSTLSRSPTTMTVAIPTADSARDVLATPHLRRVRAVQRPSHPRTSATPGPIEQATALRDSLRAAASAANQLLRSIKHQKKQARLVTSTLESLKQLQRVAS